MRITLHGSHALHAQTMWNPATRAHKYEKEASIQFIWREDIKH